MSDSNNNSNDDPKRGSAGAPPPPSFLKRNVIDENTGISFGGPDARTSIPEATRRVGGGISFSTFPSSASVMPSFAPPSSSMMGPTMRAVSGKAAPLEALPNANRKAEEGDWLLTKAPTLPQFHPLERTATFVPNIADVSLISSRISRVLRDRSIEATYDSAKAKVRCASMDGVDFRIRLYRGRTSQYAHGIIVEVQRRFGMSFTYHHDTQAILDAAHGKTVTSSVPPPPASASANGALVLPLVSDAEDVSGTESEQDEDNASAVPTPSMPSTSSLAMVASMFAHSDYSSQFLAYQTLIPLTSAARMGRSTAKSVATQLLQPGNPVGAKVLDAILLSSGSAPKNNNKRAYRGTLEYESDDEDGSGSSTLNDDAQYEMKLQTMAWTVLSNAVHATKGQAVTTTLREELRPALLQALEDAASNPRHAQMAALCAEYVCMDDTGDEDDLVDALEQAVQIGRIKHAGLKAQAQRCLDKVRRAA
jgi:hypothetical protein